MAYFLSSEQYLLLTSSVYGWWILSLFFPEFLSLPRYPIYLLQPNYWPFSSLLRHQKAPWQIHIFTVYKNIILEHPDMTFYQIFMRETLFWFLRENMSMSYMLLNNHWAFLHIIFSLSVQHFQDTFLLSLLSLLSIVPCKTSLFLFIFDSNTFSQPFEGQFN